MKIEFISSFVPIFIGFFTVFSVRILVSGIKSITLIRCLGSFFSIFVYKFFVSCFSKVIIFGFCCSSSMYSLNILITIFLLLGQVHHFSESLKSNLCSPE